MHTLVRLPAMPGPPSPSCDPIGDPTGDPIGDPSSERVGVLARRRRWRRSAQGLALLAVALLAACNKAPPADEPVRAVRTLVVSDAKLALQHEYAAEIRARTESRLAFRVGGKMLTRPVNLGDTVKAGQVLARIDGQDLRLGNDAAQAALTAAKANLEVTETEFKRYAELRAQGFISSLELDRREASLKGARAGRAVAGPGRGAGQPIRLRGVDRRQRGRRDRRGR